MGIADTEIDAPSIGKVDDVAALQRINVAHFQQFVFCLCFREEGEIGRPAVHRVAIEAMPGAASEDDALIAVHQQCLDGTVIRQGVPIIERCVSGNDQDDSLTQGNPAFRHREMAFELGKAHVLDRVVGDPEVRRAVDVKRKLDHMKRVLIDMRTAWEGFNQPAERCEGVGCQWLKGHLDGPVLRPHCLPTQIMSNHRTGACRLVRSGC